MPWHPLEGIGRRQRISRELGRWLFLSICDHGASHLFDVCLELPLPGVSKPTPLSLSLGERERACLVVFDIGLRRVFPIHLHLPRLISFLAGVCFVLVHRSSLMILSGQWIFRILLMHPFMIWRFVFSWLWNLLFSRSRLHRTGLILHLSWRFLFLFVVVPPLSAIYSSVVRRLPLPFLFWCDLSLPLCWWCCPSRKKIKLCFFECYWLPPICIHPHDFGLSFMYVKAHLGWCFYESSSLVSDDDCVPSDLRNPGPFFLPKVAVFITQSMTRRNRNGGNRQPCLTPSCLQTG